jgi:hypothetical protein
MLPDAAHVVLLLYLDCNGGTPQPPMKILHSTPLALWTGTATCSRSTGIWADVSPKVPLTAESEARMRRSVDAIITAVRIYLGRKIRLMSRDRRT